ncbi:hypothetical protein FHS56_001494 [Thermonema lapsum]|uniref:Lipoprotein LPP20-like domain-containing protein n=1 Tax=Thermonema lapsum TaxID=28195 RepID=A0A846MRC3_9BACT|nr:LPP20 family lipoprotein [Thermonema lapsum]NIK73981.1 hypothetical protein [Thermonema lapsum]
MLKLSMKTNNCLYLLCMVALLCGTFACQKKSAAVGMQEKDNRPEWVKSRPISSVYYIGIGSASMRQPDYQETAKKNALQDLISEIKVTVSSTSFLYQLDKNGSFREEYESNIKTIATAEIENFEIVDTYDDGERYWVYYRLSKAEYTRQQEQKKKNAHQTALAFYQKAKEAEQNHQWIEAMEGYFQALFAIKNYWGENLEININGESRSLMVEAYYGVQNILNKINLFISPQEVRLKRRNSQPQLLKLRATVANQQALAYLPLHSYFQDGEGILSCPPTADANGTASLELKRALSATTTLHLIVEPNLMQIAKVKESDKLERFLIERFSTPKATVTIHIEKPVVYVESQEFNLDKPLENKIIEQYVKSELSKKGVEFSSTAQNADVVLSIKANTEALSRNGAIHISKLSIQAVAIDPITRREILTTTLDNIKGFQTDYEKAGLDAYKKAQQEVSLQLVRKLTEALL